MKCRVKCPECGAAYRVDADRLTSQGSVVHCQVCSHRWRLVLEDLEMVRVEAAVRETDDMAAGASDDTVCCPHCGQSFQLTGQEAAQPPPTSGKPVILLVDDKAFFRDYTREILGDSYEYITASNTVEALEKIDSDDPDLIILDLKLENGPRDGHHILANRSRKEIPVLVLTGERHFNIHTEDWSELEQLGARDIVEKGINIREPLISKVGKLLAESEA